MVNCKTMENTVAIHFTSDMESKRHERHEHKKMKENVLEDERARLSLEQKHENRKKPKKLHKVNAEVTSVFTLIQNLVSPSLEHNCVLKCTSKTFFAR